MAGPMFPGSDDDRDDDADRERDRSAEADADADATVMKPSIAPWTLDDGPDPEWRERAACELLDLSARATVGYRADGRLVVRAVDGTGREWIDCARPARVRE